MRTRNMIKGRVQLNYSQRPPPIELAIPALALAFKGLYLCKHTSHHTLSSHQGASHQGNLATVSCLGRHARLFRPQL